MVPYQRKAKSHQEPFSGYCIKIKPGPDLAEAFNALLYLTDFNYFNCADKSLFARG